MSERPPTLIGSDPNLRGSEKAKRIGKKEKQLVKPVTEPEALKAKKVERKGLRVKPIVQPEAPKLRKNPSIKPKQVLQVPDPKEIFKNRIRESRAKLQEDIAREAEEAAKNESMETLASALDELHPTQADTDALGEVVLSKEVRDRSKALVQKLEREKSKNEPTDVDPDNNIDEVDQNVEALREQLSKDRRKEAKDLRQKFVTRRDDVKAMKASQELIKRLEAEKAVAEDAERVQDVKAMKASQELIKRLEAEKAVAEEEMVSRENTGISERNTEMLQLKLADEERKELLAKQVREKEAPEDNGPQETPTAAWEQAGKDILAKGGGPQETTPEQWEAYYAEGLKAKKAAEGFGYKVEVPKMFEQAGAERAQKLEAATPPEHKNFFLRMGEKYRAQPTYMKLLIAGGLLTGAAAGALVGGLSGGLLAWGAWSANRALSAASAFAAVDAATQKMKNRDGARALKYGAAIGAGFLAPTLFKYVDNFWHVTDTVKDWLGMGSKIPELKGSLHDVGKGGAAVGDITGSIKAPLAPAIFAEHLFDSPVKVTEADRVKGLWGILEHKLSAAKLIDASTPPQKVNFMLQTLEDALPKDATKLKAMGFGSGNMHIIRAGENLNLSMLKDTMYKLR